MRRFGVRMSRDGTREFQRYHCAPVRPAGVPEGDERYKAHTFQLPVVSGRVEPVPYLPPEPCPLHEGSKVIRYGTERPRPDRVRASDDPNRTPQRRRRHPGVAKQRYLCTPVDGDPHVFTPKLPRLVVQSGETCQTCGQARCVHRGETVVARGHRYPTWVVAEALRELGQGQPYGAVSLRAFQRLGGQQPSLLARLAAAEQDGAGLDRGRRQNAWRLAADWTELFAPVLFAPWTAGQVEAVRQARALPAEDRPVAVAIIDDIPVFSTRQVRGDARQKFAVLALFEVFISPRTGGKVQQLRLLRAYPRHDAAAYRLLLNELGYTPDYVLSDGATGIFSAVRATLTAGGQSSFQPMLSAFHVRNQLRRLFAALNRKGTFHPGDLDYDLETWAFCAGSAAWQHWWRRFEARATAQGFTPSAWNTAWVRDYKPVFDRQMPVLDRLGVLPRTPGELEAVLFNTVKPSIDSRARGFGNLLRTNRLLDLMVLSANGQLDNPGAIAAALRADAEAHAGYAAPARTIADPGMHRSLTSPAALEELAKAAGVL